MVFGPIDLLKSILAEGEKGLSLQRYKGLGEMDAGQLRDTTMARDSRQLRRVTVGDAEVASGVFDLLMGSDVAPRKEFIISGAHTLDRARIDV